MQTCLLGCGDKCLPTGPETQHPGGEHTLIAVKQTQLFTSCSTQQQNRISLIIFDRSPSVLPIITIIIAKRHGWYQRWESGVVTFEQGMQTRAL